ncbi:hypothetical protein SAY86_015361 [Trapa natans]|uniref:Hs1pro-1 C-terminal domain-containing protein n=1 Tax=Trapa natans TaxID=22666 RepID=A0AAN7QGV3_TRANT|nr:hypothetical protein SAY86_015361 [Trapa natans]
MAARVAQRQPAPARGGIGLERGGPVPYRRTSEAEGSHAVAEAPRRSGGRSEAAAERIQYAVECAMRGCPFTLGLGEPNLAAKQCLDYDGVVKPDELHAFRQNPYSDQIENKENQALYTIHQILEAWLQSASELLNRIAERIESRRFEVAASDCFLLEGIWKLLAEVEDLHLLMDTADFFILKSQLDIRTEAELFCFKSLVELTRRCRQGPEAVYAPNPGRGGRSNWRPEGAGGGSSYEAIRGEGGGGEDPRSPGSAGSGGCSEEVLLLEQAGGGGSHGEPGGPRGGQVGEVRIPPAHLFPHPGCR